MKVENKFADICIAFTIITVLSSFFKVGTVSHLHLSYRFAVTAIGIGSMYIFEYLEHWPLRYVEILHYGISMGMVFLFAWVTGIIIEPVDPNGYRDLFFNYTTIYVIASIAYEIKMRSDIAKQNRLLMEISNQD